MLEDQVGSNARKARGSTKLEHADSWMMQIKLLLLCSAKLLRTGMEFKRHMPYPGVVHAPLPAS